MSKWLSWTVIFLLIAFVLLCVINKCFDTALVTTTLSAVFVALFKDEIINILLPPNLCIHTSTDDEYLNEVPNETKNLEELQCWLSVSVENKGLRVAKNVSVFFRGINSNRIDKIKGYVHLQLRRAHLEPKPNWNTPAINIPSHMKFYYGLCSIQKNMPDKISFNFSRIPHSFKQVSCTNNAYSYFEFEILAISENGGMSVERYKIEYNGDYRNGFTVIDLKNNKQE